MKKENSSSTNSNRNFNGNLADATNHNPKQINKSMSIEKTNNRLNHNLSEQAKYLSAR